MGLVSPFVGTLFPISPGCALVRAPFASGIRGLTRSRSCRGSIPTSPPRRMSRRRSGWLVWGGCPSGSFEQDDMDNWQECTRGLSRSGVAASFFEHADGARI